MYNTVLQTSLLLFGGDIKTIRFEANMLRSLGIKSIRGIVEIEAYLRNRTVYPAIDAFLVHEHCTPYTGIEFIEKLRVEFKSTTPIILILSAPPSVLTMQTLDALSSVALVRPYTRRDVQRALVQSKRILMEKGSLESAYYERLEEEMGNAVPIEQVNLSKEQQNSFLVGMIHFQFYLRSQEYASAAERLMEISNTMSKKRMLSLIERTAKETPNKDETIMHLCTALEKHDKDLAHSIGSALLELYEQKNTVKKLSERKARVVSDGQISSVWKNLQ